MCEGVPRRSIPAMSELPTDGRPNHLAARAARWSVRHRRRAIGGWLLFVVITTVAGSMAGLQILGMTEKGVGESGRADDTLNAGGFEQPARERLVVASDRLDAADPGFSAAVADVRGRLDRAEGVTSLSAPRTSADGHSVLLEWQVSGPIDEAADRVGPAIAAVDAAREAHPQVSFGQTGDATIKQAVDALVEDDFAKAEYSALPITLAILALAFGAIVAALVPVLLGMTAVMAAIGVLAFPSHLAAMEESVNSVVLLIGLAVGVDYALFYMRRVREERAAGRDQDAAIEAAARTSGHAVLVSGMTIIAAVSGMFLSSNPWYLSYAAGIVTVVAIAMVGSVSVLPAILSKLGDKVERGRIRLPLRRRPEGEGAWARIIDAVLRRPLISAIAATGVLAALAAPAIGLDLAEQGFRSMPGDMPITQAAERIQSAFPGAAAPATVVVSGGDLRTGANAAAIERLASEVRGDARFGGGAAQVEVNAAGTVARVLVPLPGSSVDARSDAALEALREDVIPATLGRAGLQGDVTGMTAASVDMRADTLGRGPLVVGLVLLLSFVILLVTFRSVVVPLKAVVLNLMSIAAAYGVLTLVFQHGWGDGLLGFEATGSVSTWIPVFLFLLLFGLSMDYHVFILSRIREGVDAGLTTKDAVRHGLVSTAGTVTSAAVVMVGVFGIFASLSMLEIKQIGVGLAVAVLIDATIVRAVLLPATMTLLGEANWWLPRPLARRLGRGRAALPSPSRA